LIQWIDIIYSLEEYQQRWFYFIIYSKVKNNDIIFTIWLINWLFFKIISFCIYLNIIKCNQILDKVIALNDLKYNTMKKKMFLMKVFTNKN